MEPDPDAQSGEFVKSDWLPSAELYLDRFAGVQYRVFHYHYRQGHDRLLEDYCGLFAGSLESIAALDAEGFETQLKGQLLPQLQVARNLGFAYPFVYRSSA